MLHLTFTKQSNPDFFTHSAEPHCTTSFSSDSCYTKYEVIFDDFSFHFITVCILDQKWESVDCILPLLLTIVVHLLPVTVVFFFISVPAKTSLLIYKYIGIDLILLYAHSEILTDAMKFIYGVKMSLVWSMAHDWSTCGEICGQWKWSYK